MTLDLKMRVLNNLDERLHDLISISIRNPNLIKMVYGTPGEVTEEFPYVNYILFMFAHANHMKERNILSENEWAGWLQWMRNAFRQGKLLEYWKEKDIEAWFDPSFRNFVNQDILQTHDVHQ